MSAGLLLAAALAAQDAGFVYVEANVGVAVGGHVALLLGDTVVHYQQVDDRLVLVREPWARFRHSYARLQNRGLHIASIALAPADFDRLDRRCTLAWVEQELERERLVRRASDVAWLEALRDGRPPPALEGAGWFLAARGDPDAGAQLLRDAVLAAHGAELIGRTLRECDAAIAAFRFTTGSIDLEPLRETLRLREALLAIEDLRALAPASLLEVPGRAGGLAPAEVSALEAIREAQRDAIVALVRSRRADRGLALLVAVARHRASSRSLVERRLLVLDALAGAPARLAREDERESFARAARRTSRAIDERSRRVLAAPYGEASWSELEQLVARHHDALRGSAGLAVRESGVAIPHRPGVVALRPPHAAPPDQLAAAAAAAHAAWEQARADVEARTSYSLLKRNCVTELARLVRSSFADEEASAVALGGVLDADGLEVLPRPFYERLVATLPVRERHLPNHRRAELARLEESDSGPPGRPSQPSQPSQARWWTAIRETSTLGSTIYEPRECDGHFLLFTDDVVWRRPIRGVVNLGYGLGQGVVGLLSAPFDGGRRLEAGLHGALFSLPELVFVNVRKGTFEDAGELVER